MRRLAMLFALCSVAVPLSANESAQQHNPQDVAACTPDAWRVCGHAIPDGDRVRQCLIDNQSSLGSACWNVIERHRLASRPAARETTGQGQRPATGQGVPPVQRWRYY